VWRRNDRSFSQIQPRRRALCRLALLHRATLECRTGPVLTQVQMNAVLMAENVSREEQNNMLLCSMEDKPPLNYSFTAPIGIDIKGEIWACIEVPGSAKLFGTKKSVRVDAEVDGIALPNVALVVTGKAGVCFPPMQGCANNSARISATL